MLRLPSLALAVLSFAFLLSVSPAAALVSDDFNAPNLNPAWTFVNPAGDAALRLSGAGTADARLEIAVPAGKEHDLWTGGNFAPRLMQKCPDTDFAVEAKFDSPVGSRYQMQGIVVESDPNRFLRFEFMGDGAGTRVFAASVLGTSAVVRANKAVPGGSPLYMRVRRTGSRWEQAWSPDGVNWTVAAAFDLPLPVASVGVYAGNAGSPAPAHTARIDYVFDSSAPIVPEDGVAAGPDTAPPRIYDARIVPAAASLEVNWKTDETATGAVAYGKTATYELGTVRAPAAATAQKVTLSGLEPDTSYQMRITARDGAGNEGASGALTARTAAAAAGCAVRLWYGPHQVFGDPGISQRWVNILGDVAGCSLKSLVFRLNDGPARSLSIGPDGRRLASKGDFNVEIPRTDLRAGLNRVEIVATETSGAQRSETATVDNVTGRTWPLPYHLSWSTASSPAAAAQVVDGRWALDGGGVRPRVLAYDRTVAVGDIAWSDYEVLVPVTLLGVDPGGYNNISGSPGIGLILRWTGHFDWGGRQPTIGWKPVGATAWYKWDDRLKLRVNDRLVAEDTSGRKLAVGKTYLFRMRVETLSGGAPAYKVKVWPQGTAEPAVWTLSGTGYASDPARGSLLLVAHHVDVRFGSITVTPVGTSSEPPPTTPPPASGGPVSDTFDGSALNTRTWSFVNPKGDAKLTVSGGKASIALPAGTEHDLWTGGNFAPRIMQKAGSGNFEVEAKFDSPVSARYQTQGIVVEGGTGQFLRCEFQGDGSATRLFVAAVLGTAGSVKANRVIAGGAPLYMRVKRSADTWTVSYSSNGSTWTTGATFTQPLAVSAVGVYGGNAGSPAPAHTATIDYFRNTASP